MKKVFFDKLDSRKNKLLAIPMIVFLLIYVFTAFTNPDSSLHKISAILGFGLSVVFFGKQFFYRNYLGWNKKGMTIKLNSLFSKTISFSEIGSYAIEKNRLEIVRLDGSKIDFKLNNLRSDHIDQLQQVLESNTLAKDGGTPSLP